MPPIRLHVFPSGPTDGAPANPAAMVCSDSKVDSVDWTTASLVSPNNSTQVTVQIPPTFHPATEFPLPDEGGALWADGTVTVWQHDALGEDQRSDSAAIGMWLSAAQGYPTIGAPENSRLIIQQECRREGSGAVLWQNAFEVLYPSGRQRFFLCAAWTVERQPVLRAVFHGEPRWREVAIAIVQSVRLRRLD